MQSSAAVYTMTSKFSTNHSTAQTSTLRGRQEDCVHLQSKTWAYHTDNISWAEVLFSYSASRLKCAWPHNMTLFIQCSVLGFSAPALHCNCNLYGRMSTQQFHNGLRSGLETSLELDTKWPWLATFCSFHNDSVHKHSPRTDTKSGFTLRP